MEHTSIRIVAFVRRFPRDPNRRRVWIEACDLNDVDSLLPKSATVCSNHFAKNDFETNVRSEDTLESHSRRCRKRLKSTAVPFKSICVSENVATLKTICHTQPKNISNGAICATKTESTSRNVSFEDNNTSMILAATEKIETANAAKATEKIETANTHTELMRQKWFVKVLERRIKKLESMRLRDADVIETLRNDAKSCDGCRNCDDNDERRVMRNLLNIPGARRDRNDVASVYRSAYSHRIKRLATNIHYYSPRGYRYIRHLTANVLPHPKTIARWYAKSTYRLNNGFESASLTKLRLIVSRFRREGDGSAVRLPVAVVFDEMSIRRHVDFGSNGIVYGYIDDLSFVTTKSICNDRCENDERNDSRGSDNAEYETTNRTNCETSNVSNASRVATEALVFCVSGITGTWKLPIAYYLTDGLSASTKTELIRECLKQTYECGADVISITFDGLFANFKCARELGCDFDVDETEKANSTTERLVDDVDNDRSSRSIDTDVVADATNVQLRRFKPWFDHPCDPSLKISVFVDPCHALKLVRNVLARSSHVLVDADNGVVHWNHVLHLFKLQQIEGMHLANKLKRRHIDFRYCAMKVNVAAQTISRSVATALRFCKQVLKLPQFNDCDATVKFLLVFNDAFDVLNSKFNGVGLKRCMTLNNMRQQSIVLQRCARYCSLLRIGSKSRCNGDVEAKSLKSVINTKLKTGFVGFASNAFAATNMFDVLTKRYNVAKLPMYRISQDHVETLFSVIRACGGFNNNPTTRQFVSAIRKIICHVDANRRFFSSYEGATNCEMNDETENDEVDNDKIDNDESDNDETNNDETNNDDELDCNALPNARAKQQRNVRRNYVTSTLYLKFVWPMCKIPVVRRSMFQFEVIKYVSGFVQKRISRYAFARNCYSCGKCLSINVTNSSLSDYRDFRKGSLTRSASSILRLCLITDAVLRAILNKCESIALFNIRCFARILSQRQLRNEIECWTVQHRMFDRGHIVSVPNVTNRVSDATFKPQRNNKRVTLHAQLLCEYAVIAYVRSKLAHSLRYNRAVSKRHTYNKLILFKGH